MPKYGIYGLEVEPTERQKIALRDRELYCKCNTATRLCCAIFPWAKSVSKVYRKRILSLDVEYEIHEFTEYLGYILCLHKDPHFEPGLDEDAKENKIDLAIRVSLYIACTSLDSPAIDIADVMRCYAEGDELERLRLENARMRRYIDKLEGGK